MKKISKLGVLCTVFALSACLKENYKPNDVVVERGNKSDSLSSIDGNAICIGCYR